MNVVVAMDSFKGSVTSLEAGQAVADGIHKVDPDAKIAVRPLADGGEGTVEALSLGMHGKLVKVMVTGPLGETIESTYGIIEEQKTAIIEMASAAGITLVPADRRNPLKTTTYGVGELIKDAIIKGCRHFIIGIGGSATNDGGIGMLQALGFGLLDGEGKQVAFGANGLKELEKITDDGVIPELLDCTFHIACDVKNPLCGDNGCSAVFGPQKGAAKDTIAKMDHWLSNYAQLAQESMRDAKKENMKCSATTPGTGAAGGLGFAFMLFTNARLESGVSIILEETNLVQYIKEADLLITGEGKLDGQTIMGKAPIGVAKMAKQYHKKVIAFAGSVSEDAEVLNAAGIDAYFPILQKVTSLEEAMDKQVAKKNIAATATQVYRLICTQNNI